MDLGAFIWSIDNSTFTQFGFNFLGTVVPLSADMMHVMNRPFQTSIERINLYLTPCDDIPILDRISIPPELITMKSLVPGDVFMALASYYNKPLELGDLQRLSNFGSLKARAALGSSGTLVLDPSVCRRNLMGSRLNFRGLVPYRDGFLVRIE